MKRRTVILAAVAASALMAAGCGKKEAATEKTSETASVSQETETNKTGSAEETEQQSETEAPAEETEGPASETETPAEETEGPAAETEEQTEAAGEQESEQQAERPDYKASDFVTLGDYEGMVIEMDPIEVTNEDIQAALENDISTSGKLDELTTGEVQEGDIASIDYEGKKDGVAFDGGTAKGYDLTIGSHTFIDGFEEGLVGAKIGDTVDLNLTFPENYGSADLAGQDVVFTVTVNSVKRMPEVTDELIKEISDGSYNTIDEYKAMLKDELLESKESSRENEIYMNIMSQLYNTCTINGYPQEVVDYTVDGMRDYYKSMAEQSDMEFADFLQEYMGMDEATFETQAVSVAQSTLDQELYLRAIAEEEEIGLTDEEYQQGAEKYAADYGMSTVEELEDYFGKEIVRVSLIQDKVMEYLKENAVITEKGASAETELTAETETETTAE